ncbi:hypothetical protein [Microcoleus asticus]|uniref:Lipoprotein n=1 Tax=Microcoleus asticus IPMA8 TaxID=2563858 RepID=A0ABX2D6Y4_9CYAN|nr:hypothetical protein [Microcoleus asticus]NQE37665.1 hypothetical protein [Microcoleus asticus IPMA8]
MNYQDHITVVGKISVILLVLVSGCSGFENTSNPNTVSNQVPTPTPTPTPTTASTQAPNPFESVSFPLDACGDKLPEDQKVYPVSLYPVFLEYSEEKLSQVKSSFCRDAIKKVRESTGKDEIQVASFIGTERANQFKEFMSAKVGISGSIGQPTVIAAKSTQTPIARTTPQPTSTPEESLITSSSDFETITLKCGEKPAAKYIDLEFGDCWSGSAKSKNYSTSWYESSSGDNKIQLIGGGGELSVDLPPRSNSLSPSADSETAPIYKLRVRRLTSEPLRTITVNCDAGEINIWGVRIIPKCNSSGSYIEVKQAIFFDHNVVVKTSTIDRKPIIFRSDLLINSSYYISSKKRQVELTFSVE